MAFLPMLHRLAMEVEATPACQLSHTDLGERRQVQAQHPTCEAFPHLGLVLGCLHSTALGHFKALAWSEVSNQALLWVVVPLQIMRTVREIKWGDKSPFPCHGFSCLVKH